MSTSRAVGTCHHCGEPVIYRHWNGHRAWTHRVTGNVSCAPPDMDWLADPSEPGKYENGEEP